MRRPSSLALVLVLSSYLAVAVAGAGDGEPAWPSLEHQLARERVPAGSALETLIESNQDFQRLRPEEARDGLPFPLWLRALWRSEHPEAAEGDPIAGYPFVLKEIHEWMTAHPDLVPPEPEPDRPPVMKATASTGGDRRISGGAPNPRSESDIRVNYWNPSRIIAASNNIKGSGRQAQFYSSDGGDTWGQTTLPLVAGDLFHSDPTVDWTSDGKAWATALSIRSGFKGLVLRSYVSRDGGANWVYDGIISGKQTTPDKQMVWADHSNSSPWRDNLYAVWHSGAPVYVNVRRPGKGWGKPVRVSGKETRGTGLGGDIKTNSAGHVFAFWPDMGGRGIYLVRSTNGGKKWSSPSRIASTRGAFDIGVPAQSLRRALIYVSGGAYRAAGRNMVYAVWTDLVGSNGCNSPDNEPGEDVGSACKTRIWFVRSTDGGATWSAPRMLHNPATRNDQFNQALVVDEASGAIAVVYYDTAADPGRKKTDLWYQSSHDDGVTWTKPLKVSTASSDMDDAGADAKNQYGDYNGLSGYGGLFFPSWTDRRKDSREEIWSATIEDVP